MSKLVEINTIFIPSPLGSTNVKPLEDKLRELGEEAKILGIIRIRCGIYDENLGGLMDGTQIFLNRKVSDKNFHRVKEFLREHYRGSYICDSLAERFGPQGMDETPKVRGSPSGYLEQ